ncbi:MAG: archaeosortase/exosortase family protein [Pyrinomonadaceae bacterium]
MRRTVALIVALQLCAFWPVWCWYAARVTDSMDETWSLLALATAVFLLWRGRPQLTDKAAPPQLLWPTLLILLYAATYAFLPPLLRALIAVTAIGCTLCSLRFGKSFHAGAFGLLYLSLPLIPSLQFYGGYPLRVLVACAAAPILRLGGFAVMREGTCLNWNGQLIWIDAPCSGIRMLWVGLYLACTLACVYELRFGETLRVLFISFLAIICGNIFRSVALFYVEGGIVNVPPWTHDFAGVVAFAIVAAGIVASVWRVRKREELCGAKLSM